VEAVIRRRNPLRDEYKEVIEPVEHWCPSGLGRGRQKRDRGRVSRSVRSPARGGVRGAVPDEVVDRQRPPRAEGRSTWS